MIEKDTRNRPILVAAISILLGSGVTADEPKKGAGKVESGSADRVARQVERYFRDNDADKDGKLTRKEFPRQLARLFDQIDTNKDGFVTVAEDSAFRRERNRRRAASRGQKGDRSRDGTGRRQLPEGIVAHRDIEYAKVAEKSLKLDVYSPRKVTGSRPLIVWVHGGAWRAGNKNSCPALRFLDKGFVVASISYRFSQEAIYPAQIHDCKAAIRWLRKNAATYGIAADRIGVWGSSAGGHLVALLGTSGDVKELEGTVGVTGVSSRVQAVCDFFGPTDFLQMDAHSLPGSRLVHDAPDSPESQLIGGPIQENKDKVALANPVRFVSPDDPPFLICHGDSDPLVPFHQSVLLYAALHEASVDVTSYTVTKAGHGFRGRKDVDKRVDAFFQQHLNTPARARGSSGEKSKSRE